MSYITAAAQYDAMEPHDGALERCARCRRTWEDHYVTKVGAFCDEQFQVEFEERDLDQERDDARLEAAGL